MIGDWVRQIKLAKPAICQIEVNLITQSPFGPDAHDISDQQHAHCQFWINRRATQMAVERLELRADDINVKKTINLAQNVVGRQMRVQIEVIKQPRRSLLNTHHRQILIILQ